MFFFSRKKMSLESIDEMLSGISELYDLYAKKYGEHIFSRNNFRIRYLDILKRKADMYSFFKAELNYLREQGMIIRDKIEESKKKSSLDQVVDTFVKQTDSYPEVEINDRSSIEMRRLLGACLLIYQELSGLVSSIPMEKIIMYNRSVRSIKEFIRTPYSPLFEDYLNTLDKGFVSDSQIDTLEYKITKEIGQSLHTILSVLKSLNLEKDEHMVIVEDVSKILSDFRLEIFK